MIASAIYDLTLSYSGLFMVFVRDKPLINRTDVLKHSHITLMCIHDRSANLAAEMGTRLRGLLYFIVSYYLLGFSILAPLRFPSPSSSPDTLLRLMRYL